MKQRKVTEIRTAHPARDGDGVAIRRIAGMGHAGMDPVVMIDDKTYGQMSVLKLQRSLDERENVT